MVCSTHESASYCNSVMSTEMLVNRNYRESVSSVQFFTWYMYDVVGQSTVQCAFYMPRLQQGLLSLSDSVSLIEQNT